MRPCERNANDGYSQSDRCDDVPERKPPSRQQQPDHVSDQAQRSGADVGATGEAVAAHGLLTERQQSINGDIERGSCPREADNGDGHDEGSDHQAAAIQSPPKTIQRMFRSMETGAMRFLSKLE